MGAKHKCKNSKNKKCKWIGSAGPCQDKPGSKHTNIDMTQEGWAKPTIGKKKITKERMKKALAKFGYGMVRQTCDNTCSKCEAKHKCKNSKNKKCKWIGSAGPCQDKK